MKTVNDMTKKRSQQLHPQCEIPSLEERIREGWTNAHAPSESNRTVLFHSKTDVIPGSDTKCSHGRGK